MSASAPRAIVPWVVALAGGLFYGRAFEEQPFGWLAWLALVPLAALVVSPTVRRPLLLGWLHGFVSWWAAMPWIVDTVAVFGGLPRAGVWPLHALMCLYLGSYHALFAGLGRRLVARRGAVTALVVLPALWVVLELVRGALPPLAFPWNLAGYAWVATPGALAATAWIGSWGLSYLVLFAAVGQGIGIVRRDWRWAVLGVLAPLTFLMIAGRYSVASETPDSVPVMVEVVQPNVGMHDPGATFDADGFEVGYQRLLSLSRETCDGRPKLLIWPESAAYPYTWYAVPRLRRDVATLAEQGCTVLVNSPRSEGDETRNSLLMVDASGVAGRYDKRRLVPFGEYVPFAEVLPFVGTLARQAGSFRPGTDVALLPFRGQWLGSSVCFEVTFPGDVAEQVRAGATVLVTVTNDAWYGDSSAPWQHFRAARFRAAENRRPMLRAAITGVSGLIDARGRVSARLGVGEVGTLAARVSGDTNLSPFARAPWLVPWLCCGLVAFAIIRRRRR